MKRISLLLVFAIAAIMPLMAQKMVDLSQSGPGVKEISITNEGMKYDIKEIKVKVGDTVKITFTNGGGFHDLVIDEFNVATKRLGTNKSETIEFKAAAAGEYEFYCSVGNHRAMGMWGTLVVVN